MSEIERRLDLLLEAHLKNLAGLHGKSRTNHNIFLQKISPTIADTSGLTRSLTSRLGNSLHRIARGLAVLRYGSEAVPPILGHVDSVSATKNERDDDTIIRCTWDEQETRQAATRLLREAGSRPDFKIGSSKFKKAYLETMDDLSRTKSTEPWTLRVDLVVLDPMIGICELESGGELDTSNVKGQPEKLILAGLALGKPELPLHFSLAYANQGEGEPIRGGLPKYLTYQQEASEHAGGLLIGEQWWNRVLPPDLDYEDFVQAFQSKVAELDVVPPEYRPT